MDGVGQDEVEKKKFEMKKSIGLWGGVSIIAGTVVGSGIFISPVGVLAGTNGSIGLSLVLWVVCGIFCALAALCYAELGTCVMESGGEFAYLNAAYGGPFAFMFVVCSVFVLSPSADAAKSIAIGKYALAPLYPGCEPPVGAVKCTATVAVLSLGIVNYISVKYSTKVQMVCTVAKFVGMLAIIIAGFISLGSGNGPGHTNFQNAFDPTILAGVGMSQVGLAFYQGLFSYNGWNKLNFVTEEVKDAGKTLPRCIIIAGASVTIFYILVNIAYISVLTTPEILSSKAVAATFADQVFAKFSWVMPLLVCLSVIGSLNGCILSGCRVVFAAARRGHLPQIFSMIHVSHTTPGPAILLHIAMILILLIPSDFDTLINMLSFTAWTFYGLCAAGVLVLRYKRPDLPRPYKVPTVIPVVVVIFAFYLVLAPFVQNPDIAYLYGLAMMVLSPLVYYPFIYKKIQIPWLDDATRFLQLLLDVSPTNWEDKLKRGRRKEN